MWVDLLSIRLINAFALKSTLRKRPPKTAEMYEDDGLG